MAARIEDYAFVGDCHTGALVAKDGSIDWLCLPRFDSPACFAALLGTPENGRWLLAPAGEVRRVQRRYRDASLVLETVFETAEGTVAVIDCMPPRAAEPNLVRVVEGRSGRVAMRTEAVFRFDYGAVVPWVTREGRALYAVAGPDALRLHTDVPLEGVDRTTRGEFAVAAGERVSFDLAWYPSYREPPAPHDGAEVVADTERYWREWAARCPLRGPWREPAMRSLATLKALTFAPTGGIVAAATTSLPEGLGGERNWDYRYCWLRDAAFVLLALTESGYLDEARAWREWLLRAVAGDPSKLQIMYGITGARRLPEWEVPWLAGYEGASPVRVGNAAHRQFQLDVYGELLDAIYQARCAGLPPEAPAWDLERALLDFLEGAWTRPDHGMWEVRAPPRRYTHSRVRAWVAVDRSIRSAEQFALEAPLARWRALRAEIHADVCRRGYDPDLGSFVQSYGSKLLDASLLQIPRLGFLPATDPRVRGTVAAVERHLLREGFVMRYQPGPHADGLPGGEGVFLACSFWLADCLAMLGRRDDARRLFERLLALRNDVGLLSEEYDPDARRLVGNFPQAFSHVALVNTARRLTEPEPREEHK